MGEEEVGLSCPGSGMVPEGARFENPEACETIGPHLVSSSQSQSLAEESEADETPIKTNWTR
jgi:hypothetical protein